MSGHGLHSALESVAAYGSVSYGMLSPSRLKAVLLGEVPTDREAVQIHQALAETPLYRLSTMAKEIGLPYPDLESRVQALFDQSLEHINQWTRGASF